MPSDWPDYTVAYVRDHTVAYGPMAAGKLEPRDWTRAALEAIAKGGIAAVVVETLARRLGVSKGSFYWHFPNRAALIGAAVEFWEETNTEAVIRRLEPDDEPDRRLRRLFMIAFGDPQAGRVEAALIAQPDDPRIGPVVARVTTRRIAYIASVLGELGFGTEEAHQRALVAYGAYLGLYVVRAGNPAAMPASGRSLDSFVDDLVDLLTRR